MADVITHENPDGSVTTEVLELGRRWVSTVTPQEAARLALTLYGRTSIGASVSDIRPSDIAGRCFGVGAAAGARLRDYSAPANFAWDTLTKAEQAKHGGDIQRWWSAIGKDARVSTRASFAALKAERPNDTPAQARAWWGSLSSKSRQRLREKYTKGYGDDFFDDIQSVVRPVANVVSKAAPLAKMIPGYGPVIAQGIQDGAAAATSITDPKKALAALAGGQGGLKALALVRGASVSKTLGEAAKSLSNVAPATAGKLDATAKLNLSSIAAGLGAPASAQQLAASAQTAATRAAKQGGLTAKQTGQLLSQAYGARERLISSNAAPGPLELLERARKGRIRSSRGGAVTPAELAAAQAAGRVFYVS